MSKVYFTSDLHFGHKNLLNFSPKRGGIDSESHDEWLIEEINKVIHKRDILWILGDVAFGNPGTKEKPREGWYHLSKVGQLHGTKKLVLGNHDDMPIEAYQQYFQEIFGFKGYKGLWLSHAPIHPNELRDRLNVHGHVHHHTIPDNKYYNVCVEENMIRTGTPVVSLDKILLDAKQQKIKQYIGEL